MNNKESELNLTGDNKQLEPLDELKVFEFLIYCALRGDMNDDEYLGVVANLFCKCVGQPKVSDD